MFTRPWKISMPLHRQKGMTRVLEYQCRAEMEEANGDFKPDPRTWYQKGSTGATPAAPRQVPCDGTWRTPGRLSAPHA